MKDRYTRLFPISIAIAAILVGMALGPEIRHAYLGPALGMIAGMYVSWLISAAARENEILNQVDEIPSNFQEIETTNTQQQTRSAYENPILNPR